MEELEVIINMIKQLPQTALWVLVGFWAYKVIVIGSIYGLIRFIAYKIAEVLLTRKAREVEYKEIRPMLDGVCIKAEAEMLIAQINRLRGRNVGIKTDYIHRQSIDWLREAIDEKIQKESEKNINSVVR